MNSCLHASFYYGDYIIILDWLILKITNRKRFKVEILIMNYAISFALYLKH